MTRINAQSVARILSITLSGVLAVAAPAFGQTHGTWTVTGSLHTARHLHTAMLLKNGKVLVAGGINGNYELEVLSSAELYDPSTGTWAQTGSMSTPRFNHTATLLPNGEVLVAGGNDSINNAELYNPSTGQWTPTGSMTVGGELHGAVLLPNSEVLVAGGEISTGVNTGRQRVLRSLHESLATDLRPAARDDHKRPVGTAGYGQGPAFRKRRELDRTDRAVERAV